MAQFLTEDEVRDADKFALGFNEKEKGIQQGTGQITTFNQLGIKGVSDKPDGWYIPDNKNAVAILLETKNSKEDIGTKKIVDEIKKNCQILMDAGWKKVVGILHNGYKTSGFFNNEPIDIPNEIQNKKYYIDLVNEQGIPTQKIYDVTRSINNNLHVNFGVKNLYHRMIFTACALVAQRYGARLESLKDRDFSMLHGQILSTLNKSLEDSSEFKLSELVDEYYIAKSLDYGHLQEGDTAFINRSQVNNGIQGYVKADAYEKPNCITIGMIGNSKHAFWQTIWFVASQNILVLRNAVWNNYSASFICSIINSLLSDFQDYKDIIKKDDWMQNTKIKLPITSTGKPDWQYMEDYMKQIMNKSEQIISDLQIGA